MTLKTKSIQWILFLAMMVVAFNLDVAKACGTTSNWIAMYQSATDDGGRESALGEISSFCGGYEATKTGTEIAKVLLDANNRALNKRLIRGILERYRCFPDVIDERISIATKALASVLKVHCPAARSYVRVKVNGLRLRKRPRRSSEVLGTMRQNELLDFISRSGTWVKVRHWNDVVGFVSNEHVETYEK